MIPGNVLRASSVSKAPLKLREASATLLPPIPLYRKILRCHKLLTSEMRTMGDVYIKAEFRRHKEISNPVHIIGFLSQWKVYLDEIPKDPHSATSWKGRKLDPTVFEKMSAEQVGQLYELMHATKDVWKSEAALISDGNADTASSATPPTSPHSRKAE